MIQKQSKLFYVSPLKKNLAIKNVERKTTVRIFIESGFGQRERKVSFINFVAIIHLPTRLPLAILLGVLVVSSYAFWRNFVFLPNKTSSAFFDVRANKRVSYE